mmetsp:Transcript_29502/g.83211  ORF Transcript_29502/g.83211 Transcript_29502/m.83211 type:complete len:376 (+) Transcript_29502:187-1314(+)|eukprot:CAMPEP_0117652088 /NCGR_PEP_ID=MMETSP0804-20121206/2441_1 /TAXON_ID=1074897 /ORGANISM="Tetraselmis astigmatica, Strain CCMP880" /LENGTH=375 /DNA_ID=CAMNT_0005458113 /DNA_START=83 /DNA_END=1210 /DNA_ORIENTATION=+
MAFSACCHFQGDPDHVKGLTFVLITSFIWVLASFIVQDIDKDLGALPLTYIANSLFTVYLPVFAVCLWWQARRGQREPPRSPAPATATPEDPDQAEEASRLLVEEPARAPAPTYKTYQTLRAAVVVAPLWFLAQFTFNQSLSMTSVSSNTVISSASPIFTFMGSVFFLREEYTSLKLASVTLCMAGTICVGIADQSSSERQGVWGDLLSLLSTVFYASYTLAIKHFLPNDEALGMSQFFGFMGCVIMVALGPVLLLLQLSGELHMHKAKGSTYGWAVTKGLLDNVLTDYLWARAVVLVGPTIATLGLSVQVPLAMTIDLLIGRSTMFATPRAAVFNLLGSALVLAGFVGINLKDCPWLDKLTGRPRPAVCTSVHD